MSSDLARIEEKVNQIEISLKRLVLLILEEMYGYGLSIDPFEDLSLVEIFQMLDDETFDLFFPFDEDDGDEGEDEDDEENDFWRLVV